MPDYLMHTIRGSNIVTVENFEDPAAMKKRESELREQGRIVKRGKWFMHTLRKTFDALEKENTQCGA